MSERKTTWLALLNFIGGLGGLVAVATVVFYGGSMVEKLNSLDARVKAIETGGSPSLREYVKAAEQRAATAEIKLREMDEAFKETSRRVVNIEMDMREVKTILKERTLARQ